MDTSAPIAIGAAPPPRLPERSDDPAAAARSFEAVFIGEMTRIMMDSAPTDGPFGGGHGEEMFRSVLADHLGEAMARRGGLGIAPSVMTQMLRMQEGRR